MRTAGEMFSLVSVCVLLLPEGCTAYYSLSYSLRAAVKIIMPSFHGPVCLWISVWTVDGYLGTDPKSYFSI